MYVQTKFRGNTFTSFQDISLKTTSVKLTLPLKGKVITVWTPGDHECLNQVSCQSIKGLLRYFSLGWNVEVKKWDFNRTSGIFSRVHLSQHQWLVSFREETLWTVWLRAAAVIEKDSCVTSSLFFQEGNKNVPQLLFTRNFTQQVAHDGNTNLEGDTWNVYNLLGDRFVII